MRCWDSLGAEISTIPCLLVPSCVACLIKHGLWRAVVLRAKADFCMKRGARADPPIVGAGQPSVVADFLSLCREAKAAVSSPLRRFPDEEGGPVDMTALIAELPGHLRRWSPSILRACGTREEEHDRESACLVRLTRSLEALVRRKEDTPLRGHTWMLSCFRLLNCLRSLTNIRNRWQFKETVRKSLYAALPQDVARHCERIMDDSPWPSAATISRNQFLFDAAMLCYFREAYPLEEMVLWCWADASPQAGYEFFLVELLMIKKQDLVKAYELSLRLAAAVYEPEAEASAGSAGLAAARGPMAAADAAAGPAGEPARGVAGAAAAGPAVAVVGEAQAQEDDARFRASESMLELLRIRADFGDQLCRIIHTHVCIPQLLGSGNASLPKKADLLLHALWLMVSPPRLHGVATVCSNLAAFTTDIGTEMGLGDFEARSLGSLLAPWVLLVIRNHCTTLLHRLRAGDCAVWSYGCRCRFLTEVVCSDLLVSILCVLRAESEDLPQCDPALLALPPKAKPWPAQHSQHALSKPFP